MYDPLSNDEYALEPQSFTFGEKPLVCSECHRETSETWRCDSGRELCAYCLSDEVHAIHSDEGYQAKYFEKVIASDPSRLFSELKCSLTSAELYAVAISLWRLLAALSPDIAGSALECFIDNDDKYDDFLAEEVLSNG